MESQPQIRVGPAGWHYNDWYGYVYPEKPDKQFKELDYLSQFVDTVEINSTFYRPANQFMAAAWVNKVLHNPRFKFTAKVWQRFTHQREPFSSEDVQQYLQGIDPLVEAGKLGALLLQFPWSFKNNSESMQWLQILFDTFRDYPLVVEIRHASWDNDTFYSFLDGQNISIAAIDQPVIGQSIPLKPLQTGSIGYVRLHGRNYKHWFAKGEEIKKNPSLRYDYNYTKDEIKQIAETVRKVSENSKETYAIKNNHPRGQAVANGFQLLAALGMSDFVIPETLKSAYPYLVK